MTQQTNEALKDYLSMIAKALDPVARAHKQGAKEVATVTKQALAKFTQYMGRNRQDWNTVTWKTLYKYLTIPDQFGFTAANINEIILDSDTKSKITSIVRGLPPDYMTAYYAKPSQPIGGDPAVGNIAERAQVITNIILELSTIKLLDKTVRTGDIPDPTAPTGPTGPASGSTGPAGGPTGPAGGPTGPASGPTGSTGGPTRPTRRTSTDPTLNALYTAKYRLEMAIYILHGGTP